MVRWVGEWRHYLILPLRTESGNVLTEQPTPVCYGLLQLGRWHRFLPLYSKKRIQPLFPLHSTFFFFPPCVCSARVAQGTQLPAAQETAICLLLGSLTANSPSARGELILSQKLLRNCPINEKSEAILERGALKANILAERKQSKHVDEHTCWICSRKMPIW